MPALTKCRCGKCQTSKNYACLLENLGFVEPVLIPRGRVSMPQNAIMVRIAKLGSVRPIFSIPRVAHLSLALAGLTRATVRFMVSGMHQ